MGGRDRSNVVLLGPQRLAPTARDVVAPLVPSGGIVATVTAGWEEREAEHLEFADHLDREVANLELHRRAADVFEHDPELHDALKERHNRLSELQRLYRVRLRYLAPAAEELLRREGDLALLESEREAAFENLRSLDEHHLERIDQIQDEFAAEYQLATRPSLKRHRKELAAILESAGALCIAGGHVRKLHMRLWLFDVLDLVPMTTPVVAWSAGAMVLSEEIVLFHDSPPQGRGYAELLGPGLGVCPGVIPLPHASNRLHLEDHVRVQLLSRRFPDMICAALDENTGLAWDGEVWTAIEPTMQLALSGELVAIGEGEA